MGIVEEISRRDAEAQSFYDEGRRFFRIISLGWSSQTPFGIVLVILRVEERIGAYLTRPRSFLFSSAPLREFIPFRLEHHEQDVQVVHRGEFRHLG